MNPSQPAHTSFQRIAGYDLARALAVFGMVVVNFKLVMGAADHGPHWLLTLAGLLEGRAVATFVVLAGVGMALATRRAREAEDRDKLVAQRRSFWKRAFWLFVVGLLYTPIWPADILHFYGWYIALGTLFLGASAKRILAATAALALAFVPLILIFDYERGWNFDSLEYTDLWTPAGMVRHLFFNGFHPVVPWAAFLLFGLWLGRQRMDQPRVARRLLGLGLVVMVIAEGLSYLLVSSASRLGDPELAQALLGTAPMPPVPLYLLAGGGAATALISACVRLAQGRETSPVLRPLLATGRMALTLYVAHVILGMGTLEAVGRLEHQSPAFAVGSATLFFLLSILFSHLWLARFHQGPFEWALRRLSR